MQKFFRKNTLKRILNPTSNLLTNPSSTLCQNLFISSTYSCFRTCSTTQGGSKDTIKTSQLFQNVAPKKVSSKPAFGNNNDHVLNNDMVALYKSLVCGAFGFQDKLVTPDGLSVYFKYATAFLADYQLLSRFDKKKFQKDVIRVLDADYKRLTEEINKIPARVDKYGDDQPLHVIFSFLSKCKRNGLNSIALYELIKPLLTPKIVFGNTPSRRFPIALVLLTLYEKDFSNCQIYYNLLSDLYQNFPAVVQQSAKEGFFHMLDILTYTPSLPENLKPLLLEEVKKRIESFNNGEILKIFTFLCRGNITSDQQFMANLKSRILQMNFKEINQNDLAKPVANLTEVSQNSKDVEAKIVNHITQNPDALTEVTVLKLLKNMDDFAPQPYLLDFLESYFEKNYRNNKLPLSIIVGCLYQIERHRKLRETLFEEFEKFMLENYQSFPWTYRELHHTFWSFTAQSHGDSILFKYLEPYVIKALRKENPLKPVEFYRLTSDIANSNHIPSFELFELVASRVTEDYRNVIRKDLKQFSELIHPLSIFIAKYSMLEEKEYLNKYKSRIKQRFLKLMPIINEVLSNVNIQDVPTKTQGITFQSLFTINLEFPELMADCQVGQNIIKYIESTFEGQVRKSGFAVDVYSILKQRNIEFEEEKRIYIYFVDTFIEPNLVLQIEGKSHYTWGTLQESHQDILRDFHLTKLGYKIIKLTAYDFNRWSRVEFESKKEQIYEKIFGKQIQ